MPKVLISDKLSPKAADIFNNRGIVVDFRPGLSEGELREAIRDADGLAIRSATTVTPELLDAAENLKVVGRAGIGVDNVNIEAATQRGVVVMNTPFGNSVTTAEHTIAMIMSLARQLPLANASTHAGRWEKSAFMGMEVAGKTLGLIGCGNIGSIVADRAQGLKMRVVVCDPFLSAERAMDLSIEKVDFDVLLARADIVSIHAPLTDGTRNLLNADAIAQMRDGVRIVNCARGGIIVEADLYQAIKSGKVSGAAIDVFAEEPARENILFGLPQVIATPHLGSATSEAQENVAVQVAEQMSDYLLSGAVSNAINMPSVTAEEAPHLKPYMSLVAKLGSFAGQLTETGLRGITIEFHGNVAKLNTQPLISSAIAALLSPLLENINMVNATSVARDRGIAITETKHEQPGDYETLIRLTVKTDRRSRSISGTIFGGNRERIVEIKNIPIEAEWGKYMLYITNKDRPGVIGDLGRTLADNGVNIATFHLGRSRPGDDAIALLQVDNAVTVKVVEQLESLKNIVQVKALEF